MIMGGGGRKRGRTQRKHFAQSRENVWKHNNRNDNDNNRDDKDNSNPSWEPFSVQNHAFEEYYKEQGIVSEDEWEEFLTILRKPLPSAFRINSSGQFSHDILSQIKHEYIEALEAEVDDDVEAIRPLPWYPGNLAWQLNFSRMQLRKNQTLERFHEFLKEENEVGNITRQEAVSMVPPLFLDVQPDHYILDMCAAPGSKTFQLLEMIHQSDSTSSLPNGLVIANDVDVQRCNLLIHQTKRMCSANLIVTNHEAQHFPRCSSTTDVSENLEGHEVLKIDVLEFDRVLCDVPCSGDGTLRKAPDIWRKWNAGMGNGIHRLQVEIAMRGLTLLKIGGRMVYSTCSMNPVENEAVIAELLRRTRGSVELFDVSGELPGLVCRPGLKTWKIRDKGSWIVSYTDVAKHRRSFITPSMFPSDITCNSDRAGSEVNIVNESGGEVLETSKNVNQENNVESERNLGSNSGLLNTNQNSKSVEVLTDAASEDLSSLHVSSFPLERCMRILPHDQNSGAFFVAVLKKISCLPVVSKNHSSQATSCVEELPSKLCYTSEVEVKSEITLSEDPMSQKNHVLTEESPSDVNSVHHSSLKNDTSLNGFEFENVKPCAEERSESAKRPQLQGRWKGVDPVVFFEEQDTIASIRYFYGISESFALSGHLVTRNSDPNHVKRIYYVSKSIHEILQLNLRVGQRLKIASLGLKTFERQSSKEGSNCSFRLSSEGLPLLLPHISKQILFASLVDFEHLLKYRTVKFSDFVNPGFGDKASRLMLGCCVIVLDQGSKKSERNTVDSSSIAIICWRGRTNISVMVSQLDAKELLQRLVARFVTINYYKDKPTPMESTTCTTSLESDDVKIQNQSRGDEDMKKGFDGVFASEEVKPDEAM